MTEITPLLRGRWSPRDFDPAHEASADDVAALLEAARWAPSGRNTQPWTFITAHRGDDTHARLVPFVAGRSDWAVDASVLVVSIVESVDLPFGVYDVGGAVAHLTIEAEARGLHVRQFATFDRGGLAAEFGIEPPRRALTICAVGVPAPGAPVPDRERKPVGELRGWASAR
ncbi:MAG: nitroreductase family protein [Actinomycetes bacterium]